MHVCRQPRCDQPATSDLGFCAADHARYLAGRGRYERLAAAARTHFPDVFAKLDEPEAQQLAEFIVGHAATGARGFSNDVPLRGEIQASFDALAETREQGTQARRRGASFDRRPSHPSLPEVDR